MERLKMRAPIDIRQVSTDVHEGQVWYCRSTPYRVHHVSPYHVGLSFADVVDVRPLAYMAYVKIVARSEFFEWFTSEPVVRSTGEA